MYVLATHNRYISSRKHIKPHQNPGGALGEGWAMGSKKRVVGGARLLRRCRVLGSRAVRLANAHVHRPVQDDLFGLRPVVNVTAQQKLRSDVLATLHVVARHTYAT